MPGMLGAPIGPVRHTRLAAGGTGFADRRRIAQARPFATGRFAGEGCRRTPDRLPRPLSGRDFRRLFAHRALPDTQALWHALWQAL